MRVWGIRMSESQDAVAGTKEPSTPIIIVGASSGGIEAVSRLIEPLPKSFPAPILIAQHRDPQRTSNLIHILTRHTEMPVRQIEHHADLEPGVVYVIPSNRLVDFADSNVRVRPIEDTRVTPRPSIDMLLESAAQVYGERVIAIILTGSGSDGTSGAHQVKAHDGTVIIQNPRTAEYPSMPRSLAPTSVDFVRDLEDIGELLMEVVGHATPAEADDSITDDALETFLDHLRAESSIDFGQYKTPTILRRLRRRLVATNCKTLDEYRRYLKKNHDEYFQLVNSFLIKVTEFFRDAELFDYLRDTVVPQLIEHGRRRGKQLRVWSAGCATGEEAYSIAIIIADALGDEINDFNVRIFATDIDESAVGFGRRGVYPSAAVKKVPPDLVNRYFSSVDGEYEISKQVRSMVVFGQHDLARRSPFPSIDLVFCRNVLIYFTGELQRRALQLFAYSLRNGGFLVLGKSESTSPFAEYFSVEDQRLKVFQRYGETTPAPVGPVDTTIFSTPKAQSEPAWSNLSRSHVGRQGLDLTRARGATDRNESLLFHLPIGTVVVDRHYDIRTLNNLARHYLGIHGPAIGEDLLHLIRTMPLEVLRDAIDRAFRRTEIVRAEGEWEIETASGNKVFIEIACQRQASDADEPSGDTVSIVLTDVTKLVQERRQLAESRERTNQENQQLNDRVAQLYRINQQLVDSNRELAEANEDLRMTNEQLLVSNEEAQAAAEEIETLNEELQTTNEELETLNEELQATVEELNATNEDMQARTVELQEARTLSENERARLQTVLISMGEAVTLIDRRGEIVLMNEACRSLFGEDLSRFVPETEQGELLSVDQNPIQRAMHGDSFVTQFTVRLSDTEQRWFEASSRPVRNGSESPGSVVVIRDITDRSLRLLQEEFISIAGHELRTPLTALRGYLSMLQRHLPDADDRTQRYLAVSLDMVERLVGLINDLLDVGRLQTGRFDLSLEPTDLVALVTRTVEMAQSITTTHTLEFDPPPDEINVAVDPARVQQVLLNFLTNAVRYSPNADRVVVRLSTDCGHVDLSVEDFGIGLSPDAASQVFSRFYQGDTIKSTGPQRGLGLGLFISKEIIDAHGGEVWVESEPEKGSKFTVRIPLDS
jgi:two-component system, chemotaxis family, CheB/CheR fusion protein